jgi:hypothetical protein
VFTVDGGPASGRDRELGVWNPRIEYSTPLLGAADRFSATKKKYPKLITFSMISSRSGSIIAVSTSACPELS